MTVQTACHRAAIAAKDKIRPTAAVSLQEHRFKGNYIQWCRSCYRDLAGENGMLWDELIRRPSHPGGLKAHHGFLVERDNSRFLAAVDTGLGAPLIA